MVIVTILIIQIINNAKLITVKEAYESLVQLSIPTRNLFLL